MIKFVRNNKTRTNTSDDLFNRLINLVTVKKLCGKSNSSLMFCVKNERRNEKISYLILKGE